MALEVLHATRVVNKPNRSEKSVSRDAWNEEHLVRGTPDTYLGFDSEGDGVEKTVEELKTGLSFTKGDVGLGNVDNTSDTNKPISTATQIALNLKTTASTLATAVGAGLVGFSRPEAGAATRTVEDKFNDLASVFDFTTHVDADATGLSLFVADDLTSGRATGAAVLSPHWGPGRLSTADGNKRGKWFANVKSAPASVGNHDTIETAFNGDLSDSHFQVEHRISGATTLTQPTTGYSYTPEVFPFYGTILNESGHNQQTGGNDGRTGVCFFRVNGKQYGQGDLTAYNASLFVGSERSGSTHFLANPAGAVMGADVASGIDGAYLQGREIIFHDNGFDVAVVGDVYNFNRTNSTGAKGAWWSGYRVQSVGTQPIDSVFSATGKADIGIDLAISTFDLGANKCAISLKANDRIYFNNFSANNYFTTSFNGDYLEFASSISAFNFVRSGNSVLQVYSDKVNLVVPPQLPTVTGAQLPSAAAGNRGMEYYVSDANSTTRGDPVVGGGANFVKVYSTGSSWLIA